MSRSRLAVAVLFLLLASSALVTPALAGSDLDARVTALEERLEAKRQDHHIPGMSIVVVKDGEVVLARGFGVTDLETEAAVDADTLFMIGSTTKAFTSTLVGMMVDAGKMTWDEPIATYLPYFDPDVDSDEEGARVTVRDALSHRSGFSRMAMLLTAQDMEPREVLETANRAEAFDEYRRAFHYNNIMYLAAGTAAAEVAGSDYHKLLTRRILKPLGMKHSASRVAKLKGTLAPGYAWDDELGEHDRQPILPTEIAGPAGSIVSNANDMGRWVQFLLAGGESGGKQLIEESTLEQTWTQNIGIADGIAYGMGWMLREWEGRDFVEHGGNIHGFGAQVALIPEENLGFALMTNLTATGLQQESIGIVWEELLGAPAEEVALDETGGEDLSIYIGDYTANFGSFKDATFAVTDKDGVLYVNVPGQTDYELKPAGDDGQRPFAVTDTVKVSFETSDDGSVDMMRMHQGGMDFEIPRQGVEFPIEVDLNTLAPYLGKYRSEATFNTEVSVVVQNNRLAVDVPNQMAFELHLPDEDGRRRFRVRDVMNVTFDVTADGTIESFTLRRGDEVVEILPRTADADETPLPTIEEIMAVRATPERVAAAEALGPIRSSGTVTFVHAGLAGTLTSLSDGDRARIELEFGKFGWIRTTLTREIGEMQTHVTPVDEVEGRRLAAFWQNEIAIQTLDWRDDFETIQVLKRDELDGTEVVLVFLQNPDAPSMTLYVDTTTGDVMRFDSSMPVPGTSAEIPLITRLADYREVAGVRVPFRTISENQESGQTLIQLDKIETGAVTCDALFTLAGEGVCATE